MKNNLQLFTITDCARLLGVAKHKLVYAYDTGKLPEIRLWVGGRRVFTARDLKDLADYFGVECDPDSTNERRNHE